MGHDAGMPLLETTKFLLQSRPQTCGKITNVPLDAGWRHGPRILRHPRRSKVPKRGQYPGYVDHERLARSLGDPNMLKQAVAQPLATVPRRHTLRASTD
jgi:hypothetical protein